MSGIPDADGLWATLGLGCFAGRHYKREKTPHEEGIEQQKAKLQLPSSHPPLLFFFYKPSLPLLSNSLLQSALMTASMEWAANNVQ
jgi:hypothetical protein